MMCAGRGDFKVISVFLNGTVCSFFARTDLSDWRRGFLRLGVCRVRLVFLVFLLYYILSIYILLYIFFLYFIEYGSDRVLCNSSVRENRNVNEWWTRGF